MRVSTLALVVVAACAHSHAVKNDASYAGGGVYYRTDQAPDGSTTLYVADNRDRTRTVAVVPHFDAGAQILIRDTADGGGLRGVPLIGASGEKLSQFFVQKRQYDRDRPEYPWVAVSPPVKRVVVFHVGDRPVAYALPSGAAEPDLFLPITSEGTLAWFPDGVIGAKPGYDGRSLRRDDFAYWLVRWGSPNAGWSLSLRTDLSDLDPKGPQWVSVDEQPLYDFHEVSPPSFDVRIILGTRADGSCDAQVDVQDTEYDDVWPPPANAATCELARKALQAQIVTIRRDGAEARREALARWEREEQQRGAAEQAQLEAQLHVVAESSAREVEAYEQMLVGKHELPPDACATILRATTTDHLDVLDRRERASTLLPGEIACARRRGSLVTDRLNEIEGRKRRRIEAAQQAAQQAAAAGPTGGHNGDDDARARLYKATVDYTYGNSGVCPLARSQCGR